MIPADNKMKIQKEKNCFVIYYFLCYIQNKFRYAIFKRRTFPLKALNETKRGQYEQ